MSLPIEFFDPERPRIDEGRTFYRVAFEMVIAVEALRAQLQSSGEDPFRRVGTDFHARAEVYDGPPIGWASRELVDEYGRPGRLEGQKLGDLPVLVWHHDAEGER